MLLELVAIGQLVTFGPEGVERYCVTRYVIDEPTIEFADHKGHWRRLDGPWIMIRNAGMCQGVALEPGAEEESRAEPGALPS